MKRDVDLVRQLLLSIDGQGTSGVLSSSVFAGHSEEKIRYHLRLLADSSYLKYVEKNVLGTTILRLTWDGHELLEMARDDQVWDRAKRLVYEKTGGLAIEVIHQLLTKWAVQRSCEDDSWVSVGQVRSLVEKANGSTNGNGHASHEPSDAPRRTTPRFVATNSGPVQGDAWTRWWQTEPVERAERTDRVGYENFSFDTEDPRFGKPASWYNYSNSGMPVYLL